MNDREVGGLRVSREDAESAENARDDFKRQQPSWKISRRPRRPRRFRSSLRPLFGPVRGTGRGERRSPGTISNAELAERRPRRFRSSLRPLFGPVRATGRGERRSQARSGTRQRIRRRITPVLTLEPTPRCILLLHAFLLRHGPERGQLLRVPRQRDRGKACRTPDGQRSAARIGARPPQRGRSSLLS